MLECNLNLRAASGIFIKEHFWQSVTQKYLKITPFLEKRAFCQILQRTVSDYQMLISSGLFLECFFDFLDLTKLLEEMVNWSKLLKFGRIY